MKALIVFSLAGFVPVAAFGQTINAWTNATSSYWEFQTNWSLGTLPDQSQSLYITNSGFKAVAIGANTAQNFPQSMHIQDLQIASPTNSFNVLLMNFSGFQVPLQTTSLTVGSNSSVVVQSSVLDVTATNNFGNVNFVLNGTFNQGDFSQVTLHGRMAMGRVSEASYFLTNGTLSVDGGEDVGGFLGFGKIVQYGGSNNVGGAADLGSLSLELNSEYDLYGGQLTVTNGITVGTADWGGFSSLAPSFNQYGGSVNADMVINGVYILNAGNFTGRMQVCSRTDEPLENAFVFQNGGTNLATSLGLGHPVDFGGLAFYMLSNGVLQVNSSVTFRGGQFSQYNGRNTMLSDFNMQGTETTAAFDFAEYLLAGGTLSVGGGVTEQDAQFRQSGGTNLITGALSLSGIPVHPPTWYLLGGGTLAVTDISINANAFFQHTGGNIIQSGVLTLEQGVWLAANGDYALGPLQLSASKSPPNTNSTIIFPSGSSVLRLADSSAQVWDGAALLSINNWHGSPSGGGATQLYFGSSPKGVTLQQLNQITFSNPAGFPGGNYPAQILSNGEVVPAPRPTLQTSRSDDQLVLTWTGNFQLLSATNVLGPYQPVPEAASPYTNDTRADSQRFFILQGQ